MADSADSVVSLDEVRARFLAAEERLTEASDAVGAIQQAALDIGSTRESLSQAGERLGALAGSVGEISTTLADNALHLREGVDAIRQGDPAAIRRQIEELDAAFTAMQSVLGERLATIEQAERDVKSAVAELRAEAASHGARAAREGRIIAAIGGVLFVVVIVLSLVR